MLNWFGRISFGRCVQIRATILCSTALNDGESYLPKSYKLLLFHCCVILPYKGKRTRKICQRVTLYNPGLTGFLLKKDEANTKCSGTAALRKILHNS